MFNVVYILEICVKGVWGGGVLEDLRYKGGSFGGREGVACYFLLGCNVLGTESRVNLVVRII